MIKKHKADNNLGEPLEGYRKVCPVCGESIPASARISLPEGAYAIKCPNCGKSTTYFPNEPGTPHINN